MKCPGCNEKYDVVCCASTNNSNDATNRVTKAEDTLRELLPTGHFLNFDLNRNLVRKCSYSHCPTYPNMKPFGFSNWN